MFYFAKVAFESGNILKKMPNVQESLLTKVELSTATSERNFSVCMLPLDGDQSHRYFILQFMNWCLYKLDPVCLDDLWCSFYLRDT